MTLLPLIRSVFCLVSIALLPGCSNKFSAPNTVQSVDTNKEGGIDVLKMIYTIADEKGMRVISDLNMSGGELYTKYTADQVAAGYKTYISDFYQRYGKYKSFWGWYLNNELNPLKPDEVKISTFWRRIWKAAVDECKRVAPGTSVTISPFFIVDRDKHRGFDFVQPLEYEQWWTKTLSFTGIDVLMLQDSGAEHLSFFTTDDRRPFFQAFKNACDKSGSKLWLNVETGEVDARDWEDAVNMEKTNTQKWVYTKTDWLAEKLALAAEYGENIINWGYYPYMNPTASNGPWLSDETAAQTRLDNYNSYKAYYDNRVNQPQQAGALTQPLIKGTLWWLPVNYEGWSEVDLERAIRDQIENQTKVGFNMLWIINAPGNMQFAIDKSK